MRVLPSRRRRDEAFVLVESKRAQRHPELARELADREFGLIDRSRGVPHGGLQSRFVVDPDHVGGQIIGTDVVIMHDRWPLNPGDDRDDTDLAIARAADRDARDVTQRQSVRKFGFARSGIPRNRPCRQAPPPGA
jgi:hypothetical protein